MIINIIMRLINIFCSLIYCSCNYSKKTISRNKITTNIIYSYISFNDQTYYCHNLDLLNKYYDKNVYTIFDELASCYYDVEFILFHFNKKDKIKMSIFKIYIIYDDSFKIIEFIGIDPRNKNLINL